MVLAGVAGGLHPEVRSETAVEVGQVVRPGTEALVPPLRLTGLPAVRCLEAAAALTSVEAKRESAQRHGADVVDTESWAFGRVASRLRWSWTIVRGVSDGAWHALPEGVEAWTDARGRTRVATVAWAVARGRVSGVELLRLGGRSWLAMKAVAAALETVDRGPNQEQMTT